MLLNLVLQIEIKNVVVKKSTNVKIEAEKAILEIMKLKDVRFSRCYIPQDWDRKYVPYLIGFSDYGLCGLMWCIYARFQLNNGKYFATLTWSRGKINSVKQKLTPPKGELAGIWLLSRALRNYIKLSRIKFAKIIAYSDSQTVLGMLQCSAVETR